MTQLGNGLSVANRDEEALSVREAELSMERRLGASEETILTVKGNLANTYQKLGRIETLNMYRDVYSGWLKLNGEEDEHTLMAAGNYAVSLFSLKRFKRPRRCCAKRCPWHDAFSERIIISRSR